jgi:phenylalanyl-tRNA synthetase beta chain
MKISFNWLNTLLKHNLGAEETAKLLTDSGLEVEGIEDFETVKGGLKGLVTGHVLECAKHPDADRLSLTKVDVGNGQILSIVCGAPNVAAGQKVVVAVPGAMLYPTEGDPFEIKKSKIRGAVSEGMICAEDEIGLGKSHAGIMVLPENTKVGMPASEYFKIESDKILEIGLTPNRSDAASHLGVARDLATIINISDPEKKLRVGLPGIHYLPESNAQDDVQIQIKNTEACPRYSGLVIKDVKVAESPAWLQNRLKSIGLRPINNVVDITNFVLHELGQPLHAFDLAKIKGNKVIVRNAEKDEPFVTLDGVERKLSANDLVICNEASPMCIAGVFGGIESGVTESTTSVFLESAYFNPDYIRRTAKIHGLKTDASFRFERGTDPEITVTALTRAANLIMEIAGGSLSMEVKDVYPEKLEPYKVAFSFTNCNDLIGKDIDRNVIREILTQLGIEIESGGSDGLLLKVPRYKTDVTREADVIEEVMRIYGYNKIDASKTISFSAMNEPGNFDVMLENIMGSALQGFGFSEIMSLSLSKETLYSNRDDLVKLINPLSSDLAVMRKDMIFSGLEAIAYNINRKNSDIKFFETGKTYTYLPEAEFKYAEQKNLSLFVSGNLFAENAYGLKQKAGFGFVKAALINIFERCGIEKLKTEESNYEHFEAGLDFFFNKKLIARVGEIKNATLKKFDISQEVYYACVDWEAMLRGFSKYHRDPEAYRFREVAKFPSVKRDLALLIDRKVKYRQIEELAFQSEKKFLKEVNLFDIYEDKKLGDKKSYAVSFTLLNEEATLTDKQIDGVMQRLISVFKEKLGAELR